MEECTSGRKASWSFSGFYHKTIIHSVRNLHDRGVGRLFLLKF